MEASEDPGLRRGTLSAPQVPTSAPPPAVSAAQSLLEERFPAADVGRLARAGRSRPNPVYGAHKWWARRPAESVRALLLAAALPPDDHERFWAAYRDPESALYADKRVADPFVGGGTSLVEAQRLGAAVYGIDVDPLAALITEHELTHLDTAEFDAAASALLTHLRPLEQLLFSPQSDRERPLHYFFLRHVTCPGCGEAGLLYKSLLIARDLGRRGAVSRLGQAVAFCPECLKVHMLAPSRKELWCCGRRFRLDKGTFAAGKYACPSCSLRSTNESLQTALRPRVLIAVEVTHDGGAREIRQPTAAETIAHETADAELGFLADELALPSAPLPGSLARYKPGVYGFSSFVSLFTSRQLIVFGTAFQWLTNQPLSRRVKLALALGTSNALASNNVLCGYATDYGRLAQLFSVRDYSLPALSVELNPLHPSAGRGTLPATLRRVALSKRTSGLADTRDSSIRVTDSATAAWADTGGFDVVMTDPPYFDYIAYSDLSQFFRVWLEGTGLLAAREAGTPLYEGIASRERFAARLGESFRQVSDRLKPSGLLVFTYHATTRDGWRAVVEAVRSAGLCVSAAFPLWADAKSPGHGHAGNVEFDLVFCCRKSSDAAAKRFEVSVWLDMFASNEVSQADVAAWSIACEELNAEPWETPRS